MSESRRFPSSSSSSSANANSILRSDLSFVADWLSSTQNGANKQTQSQAPSSSIEESSQALGIVTVSHSEQTIPKPYNCLTQKDCIKLVAQAVRSVIMHTCNDEFRQQCFTKLGVNSSQAVEHELVARLIKRFETPKEESTDISDLINGTEMEMETPATTETEAEAATAMETVVDGSVPPSSEPSNET